MNDIDPRGDFSNEQIEQLLRPINTRRVITGAHVKPHLSQQDVLAHLTRTLGFGHFDVEVREVECLYAEPTENSKGNSSWSVGYRALVRLHVRDERQRLVAYYDGGSTGESEGQPSRAASHDLAYKSALSTAMKRAAIALGDQFGLSLYNKGQTKPLVLGTMVNGPRRTEPDVQEGVEQQEVDGGRQSEIEHGEPDPETETAAATMPATPRTGRKRPTRGAQGTKVAEAPKPDAEAPSEPQSAADAILQADSPDLPTPPVDRDDPDGDLQGTEPADDLGTIHYDGQTGEVVEPEADAEAARQARKDAAEAGMRDYETDAERERREQGVRRTPEQVDAAVAAETAEPEPWANDEPGVADGADGVAGTWPLLDEVAQMERAHAAVLGRDSSDWLNLLKTSTTPEQCKDVWDRASATPGAMTTELRAEVFKHRDRCTALQAEIAAGPVTDGLV